jgi:NADH dehydrogenase FAD-containing subunit
LDRKVSLDGASVQQVPYEYLVIATGTKLVPPGSLPGSEKLDGVEYLTKHAQQIEESDKIVVIGGGAVGVQMATDIKEVYPKKSVTLVHSRPRVMNRFHEGLHKIIAERAKELGIELELGSRVRVPQGGFPTGGSTFNVELENGKKIPANFAVRHLVCPHRAELM